MWRPSHGKNCASKSAFKIQALHQTDRPAKSQNDLHIKMSTFPVPTRPTNLQLRQRLNSSCTCQLHQRLEAHMVKPMTSLEPAQHRTGRSGTIRSGLGTRSTVVSRSPGLIRARCSFGYGEFLVLCNGSQIEKASVSNSVSFQTLGPKPWGSFPTNTAEQPRHTCSQSIVKPLCLICVCDIIIYTQHIYIYIHM